MAKVVVFDEFGGPEVLHVVDDPVVDPDVDEIRVRIEAFAVNPLDAMRRSGTSPGPVDLPHARLGIEATGVVDAVGAGVTGYVTGDPVIVTAVPDSGVRGTYAEFTTIPAHAVIPRPDDLDIPHAAAVWVAYSTAYGSLLELAGMRPADRVVIAGASGAVGRMAMQIARQIGAVPIAVTRDTRRTGELLAAGAAGVIGTDREDLVGAVRRHTGGAGADIVFDLVRGPGQTELLTAVRPGGTLVAAGYLDPRPTPDPGDADVRRLDFRGFEQLSDLAEVERMAAFLEAGVRLGTLRPAVDAVYALDDIVAVHRRFDEGSHGGRKLVVVP